MSIQVSAKIGLTKTIRPLNKVFDSEALADMKAHIDIEDEVAVTYSLEKDGVVQEIYSHPLLPGPERVARKCGDLIREMVEEVVRHQHILAVTAQTKDEAAARERSADAMSQLGYQMAQRLYHYFENYGALPLDQRPEC